MTAKVLCVDDDPNVLAAIKRNLRKRFDIDTAEGGELALAAMERGGPYAVIVADMQMPGMNGIELLTRARQHAPDTVRIMLTGNADQRTAIDAVNIGHISQFLNKPCPSETMVSALEDGIKQYHLITAERELLKKTLNGSVKVLMDVLSLLNPDSFGRSHRLRDYARQIAGALGVPFTWELELASLLSQIGVVTLPQLLIEKVRSGFSLTGAEKDMITRVPEVGGELLENIPRLEAVARIVRYQDKHFDGSGFPRHPLNGEAIPLESRIIKVLTDLIQLESAKTPKEKGIIQLRSREGWYDPKVLDAAARCFEPAPAAPDIAERAVVAIPFAALRSGQLLRADVRTNDGILIVTAGTPVSPLLLARLKNFAAVSRLKQPIYVEV